MPRDMARFDSAPTEDLRDGAMDELAKRYSKDTIDLEEFERRTDRAATRSELVALMADLPHQAEDISAAGRRLRRPAVYPGARTRDAAVAISGGADVKIRS